MAEQDPKPKDDTKKPAPEPELTDEERAAAEQAVLDDDITKTAEEFKLAHPVAKSMHVKGDYVIGLADGTIIRYGEAKMHDDEKMLVLTAKHSAIPGTRAMIHSMGATAFPNGVHVDPRAIIWSADSPSVPGE